MPFRACTVTLLLFWDKPAISMVVIKNLVAHRVRNRKTSIMYALSIGFIIFIVVSYDVQIKSIVYENQQRNGCLFRARRHQGISNPGALEMVRSSPVHDSDSRDRWPYDTLVLIEMCFLLSGPRKKRASPTLHGVLCHCTKSSVRPRCRGSRTLGMCSMIVRRCCAVICTNDTRISFERPQTNCVATVR